jgi:hypothetical protein
MRNIKIPKSFIITTQYIFFICLFVLGIYHMMKRGGGVGSEAFTANDNCPNILMQKGSRVYLYNSNKASVPGVNPLQFENLEEYTEFIDWQRAYGIRCPVLFMNESYDAQGKRMFNLQNGSMGGGVPHVAPGTVPLMDASRGTAVNSPDGPAVTYNMNSYPGFDPDNQYIGTTVPLDAMEHESGAISGNPMDSNWGGNQYTEELIAAGVYAGNTRKI